MKHLFELVLISLVLINVSFSALADNGCVAAEPEAEFSQKMPGLSGYKMKKSKGDNILIENFKLTDGTVVQVSQGGCAHFDKRVSFTIPKPKNKGKKFDSKFWLSQAKDLLAKLPTPNTIAQTLLTETTDQEKNLLKQKPLVDGQRYTLESTDKDGYDTVSLEVTEKKSTTQITIGVNTAL